MFTEYQVEVFIELVRAIELVLKRAEPAQADTLGWTYEGSRLDRARISTHVSLPRNVQSLPMLGAEPVGVSLTSAVLVGHQVTLRWWYSKSCTHSPGDPPQDR